MKMKIEYYIGEIESVFYQRQFVYYLTALENNREITSLTLKLKGSSFFRYHSNMGTMGSFRKKTLLIPDAGTLISRLLYSVGNGGRAPFCTS